MGVDYGANNDRGYMERLGERDIETVLTQDSGSSSLEAVAGGQTSQDGRTGSLFHSVSQDVGMGPVEEEEEGVIEDFEDDMIW